MKEKTRKRRVFALAALLVVLIVLAGCTHKNVVCKEPLDVRFTPAHTWHTVVPVPMGKHIFPMPRTYYYGDQWEVLYLITYDDGSTSKQWREVDQNTYEEARIALKEGTDG